MRGVSTIVGAAAVGLAVWVVARSFQPPRAIGHDPRERTSDGGPEDGGELLFAYHADSGAAEDAGSPFAGDLSELSFPPPREDGGLFADGTPVPPLPLTAPRQVRFGVVLVAYSGAQPSALGGRVSSRSREEAKVLAAKLLTTAAADFHAAVQQGDPGSSDDVGKVRTGILEPGPEYVLFTLPVAAIGGPVDTPRGYWIVKRLE